jgi:hypothetical protein
LDIVSIKEFIRTYVKAIRENNAAIFAGAGLSRSAGFVDWKELMREIAEDLSLDIDKESDLVEIAQYHVNETQGRNKINQILIDEFTRGSSTTENHRILSRLPIKVFWTTNYDKLIEENLINNGKKVDVKIVPENLAITVPNCDAVVYKMHGDITLPHEAVLTKDDYEGYNLKRQLFTTALQGDLVSKTFLFIGFSFDDPNLQYILSRIRILLGENKRQHYCFMKEVTRNDFDTDEEYHYAKVKQKLKINDLKRYSIKVLLIDDYSDITDILRDVENMIKRNNVFISGSATVYGEWGEQRVYQFASSLSKSIIKNGNNIVTGFGLGVGSCIISGALEEIYSNPHGQVHERLLLRPFPQTTTGQTPLPVLWTKYRNDMLSNVGLAIFICGNKLDPKTGDIIEANGMTEEFEIAVSKGIIPIPVGATGFTALQLWERVMADFNKYVPDPNLRPLYEKIGDKNTNDTEIIELIIKIINNFSK